MGREQWAACVASAQRFKTLGITISVKSYVSKYWDDGWTSGGMRTYAGLQHVIEDLARIC